jgi:Ser-tRNA(Ala) deacylase AlaX
MTKNYDPPMHTAEHVLNQTMIRLFGLGRCFSSHLNQDKSKCDYRFNRDLTEAEAKTLEAAVNEALERNLTVTEEFVSLEEANKLVDTAKLPPEAQADPLSLIRLVRIGDYDLCPCIGAHVQNTGQAAPFRLISHSFTEPNVLRLRFRTGTR